LLTTRDAGRPLIVQEVTRWTSEAAEELPDRLIQNYLDPEGRYTVLAWLATHFDYDRRYREAEVNQIVQTRHWDSATLRRELVGYRMLARERGIYWRLPEEHWLQVNATRAPASK